ncbi:MAG: hypoxanthine phosphoribosyltransferase, partial [Bacteroidetes bacterium]|nr:hypoxanthine phosphoribosyltransferase [Bacteroidota bacterium]
MREIALLDKRFREFIHEDLIRERVTGIAEDINRDLAGRDV